MTTVCSCIATHLTTRYCTKKRRRRSWQVYRADQDFLISHCAAHEEKNLATASRKLNIVLLKMYSSYGPPSGRSYIGRDSNGYRTYSNDFIASPNGGRRYAGGASALAADHQHFPPSRYRPPLPTYTMQSVSRSSSYANSANHNKNISAPDAFANSRYHLSIKCRNPSI